ncbi:hypothetical protein DEFR109230_02895 [Deinococcus frigens]
MRDSSTLSPVRMAFIVLSGQGRHISERNRSDNILKRTV